MPPQMAKGSQPNSRKGSLDRYRGQAAPLVGELRRPPEMDSDSQPPAGQNRKAVPWEMAQPPEPSDQAQHVLDSRRGVDPLPTEQGSG